MGSSIAIITARGGSKRIPRKNIKEFCGKPIISYSIEAALQSGLFEEVMVSTDDEEIAAVARAAGAQVPFMRSSASAGDYASTDDVLLEVLMAYREQGREFDTFCCLYPTAPFVTAGKLRTAMELLEKADIRLLVCGTKPYELGYTVRLQSSFAGVHVYLLCPFVAEGMKDDLAEALQNDYHKVMFAEYQPELTDSDCNGKQYKSMVAKYIMESRTA